MALALVASLFLAALAARRLGTLPPLVPAATFAAGAMALYPVAVTRYDAVVTLTLALAVCGAALGGRWLLLSYASLGYGAAAKLVPALAVLPLALSGRRAVRGLLAFAAVLGLCFVPALLFAGERFMDSFAYHAQRGVQVESLWASALMLAGQVSGIAFEFGAFEVRGEGVGLASSLSLPVTAVLLTVTALFVYRDHRTGLAAERFPRHAAALILAFMLGSKVLSPQYMLWLLPLVPLSLGGLAGYGACALLLAACVLTSRIFPVHYADLLNLRTPGPELLLARNLILVLLWVMLLSLPQRLASREDP